MIRICAMCSFVMLCLFLLSPINILLAEGTSDNTGGAFAPVQSGFANTTPMVIEQSKPKQIDLEPFVQLSGIETNQELRSLYGLALPFAELSAEIYKCRENCKKDYKTHDGIWWRIKADSIDYWKNTNLDDLSGFHATAYVNEESGQLVIVYEGTADTNDWLTDVTQPISPLKPLQFSHALAFAKAVESAFCTTSAACPPLVIGHSLGGGLAQYVSLMMGWKAYVFNAAGLNIIWRTIEEVEKESHGAAEIIHFWSQGYRLDEKFGFNFVTQLGKQFETTGIEVPMQLPLTRWDLLTVELYIHNMARLYDTMFELYHHKTNGNEQNIGMPENDVVPGLVLDVIPDRKKIDSKPEPRVKGTTLGSNNPEISKANSGFDVLPEAPGPVKRSDTADIQEPVGTKPTERVQQLPQRPLSNTGQFKISNAIGLLKGAKVLSKGSCEQPEAIGIFSSLGALIFSLDDYSQEKILFVMSQESSGLDPAYSYTSMKRQMDSSCDNLLPHHYVLFGESIALIKGLDRVVIPCLGGSENLCINSIFKYFDISDDQYLSVAEISRVLRGLSVIAAYYISADLGAGPGQPVDLMKVYGMSSMAGMIGPFFAKNLVASTDFDGNGLVSQTELLQDRGESLMGAAGPLASTSTQLAIKTTFSALIGGLKMMALRGL